MFQLGKKNNKWGQLITFGIWLVGLKKELSRKKLFPDLGDNETFSCFLGVLVN